MHYPRPNTFEVGEDAEAVKQDQVYELCRVMTL